MVADTVITQGDSVFREVLVFFNRIGIYDVVLPFLLIFSIVFALLERTKVLGTEKALGPAGGDVTTKKNLNAMVAFVAAFFVIASSRLVSIVHETLANVVLLLLVSVSFLLLVGIFHSEKDDEFVKGPWRTFMMFIMFIGVVLIFAYAIKTDSGEPWLIYAFDYVTKNFNSTAVSAIVLTLIVIGLIAWLTKGESKKVESKD